MSRGTLVAVLLAVVLAVPRAVGAKENVPRPDRWTAQAGHTMAVLTHSYNEAGRPTDRVRLTIARDGKRTFVESVPPSPRDTLGRNGRVVFFDWERPLTVRDLDGDDEPEVLLDLFWSGTRCCAWVRVYRFDRTQHQYVPQNHWWGNLQADYRRFDHGLRDLNGDGRPEFVAADDRFQELSYWSIDPIQIWSYDHGRFLDVTRRFPKLVAAEARANWDFYNDILKRYQRGSGPQREALAAWMADQYLLGHVRKADRVLARALRRGDLGRTRDTYAPNAREYVAVLKAFLRKTGYARG